jgi:two-component system, NarL family, nitrate/nitrite response regulator NarL
MRKRVSTVVVDRSVLFRVGLGELLRQSEYRVVASLADLAVVEGLRIPVTRQVLFILKLEDVWQEDGRRLAQIKARYPNARVVVMADTFATSQIQAVMRCGADACLLRTITMNELVQSLDLVMLGKSVFSEGLRLFADGLQTVNETALVTNEAPRQDWRSGREQLSPRELQILHCLMEGHSNKSIALKFCLTETTVKAHMKAVLRKIGAANRTQAAIWAHTNDIFGTSSSFVPQRRGDEAEF